MRTPHLIGLLPQATHPMVLLWRFYGAALLGEDWALGRHGMALVYSASEHLVVALPSNGAFARPSLRPADAAALPKQAAHSQVLHMGQDVAKSDSVFGFKVGERLVELSLEVAPCPGAFGRSKLVILRNRYAVVNGDAADTLYLRQEGTPDEGESIAHASCEGGLPRMRGCWIHTGCTGRWFD